MEGSEGLCGKTTFHGLNLGRDPSMTLAAKFGIEMWSLSTLMEGEKGEGCNN